MATRRKSNGSEIVRASNHPTENCNIGNVVEGVANGVHFKGKIADVRYKGMTYIIKIIPGGDPRLRTGSREIISSSSIHKISGRAV